MSDSDIRSARLYRYRIPLLRPLPIRNGEPVAFRPGWIVVLAAGAHEGLGDAAPLDFSRESMDATGDALRTAIADVMRSRGGALTGGCVGFAISSALAELDARSAGIGVNRMFTESPAEEIKINALLDDFEQRRIDELLSAGYSCLKCKVGRRTPAEDAEVLERIKRSAGAGVTIRLDANRAWSLREAREFADRTEGLGFEYIEEPLADAGRLEELFDLTGWPIALDELVVEAMRDPLADVRSVVARWQFASALVLKPSLLGDLARSVRLMDAASAGALTVTVSSSFESGVGLRSLLALASHPTAAAGHAGLSTHAWFADDVCAPPIILGARVATSDVIGLNLRLNPDVLMLEGEWTSE